MTEPNHDLVYSRHVLEHLIHLNFILVTTPQRVRVLSKRMRTSNLGVTQPVAVGIHDEGEVEEVTRLDPTLRRGQLLIKDRRNLVGPDTIYDFNILRSEDRPKPDVNLDGHFLYIERTSIGRGETLTVGPIPPLHSPRSIPKARPARLIVSLSSTARVGSKSRSVEWRFRPRVNASALPPLRTRSRSRTRSKAALIKRS